MALSVLAFVKDILALLTFSASFTGAPEFPRIAVTVKVEVVTTQYSTIEPSSLRFHLTLPWSKYRQNAITVHD
ncbi:hypothetical protein DFS33DRAFT_1386467 [Desarmillaria ectypa]|nr:hypothetical protein DFS33DRAFT_1386467 [Desarmillaria ectypa]